METTASTRPGAIIARVDSLGKSLGSGSSAVTALDGVTIGIERGRFTAIMGASGFRRSVAGRSADARIWLALRHPSPCFPEFPKKWDAATDGQRTVRPHIPAMGSDVAWCYPYRVLFGLLLLSCRDES